MGNEFDQRPIDMDSPLPTPDEPVDPLASDKHEHAIATGFAAAVTIGSRPVETSAETVASERDAVAQVLAKRGGFMRHKDNHFFHGMVYDGPMKAPTILWKSDKKPRKDHDTDAWLTATEFEDKADVMNHKVEKLAQLMRMSRHTCVYSGAGISASAVGQAALSGTNKVGWTGAKTSAQPTPTHHALALLGRTDWIHGWVQQNHDGLPQKAGFPQEKICEVHGSWYDPSNPVVKYSGCLKDHECEWMERETETADLVLVLGTSLGGLHADQVATECAGRAVGGRALGATIINLQQTPEDGKMSLRISGKSDNVLQLLLAQLGVQPIPQKLSTMTWPSVDAALVPYNKHGVRLPAGSDQPRMWLDLRPGSKVKLSRHHNCQGARQPLFMHIGAKNGQKFNGKALVNVGPGLGAVSKRDEESSSYKLSIEGTPMKLGIWWLEAAARGGPAVLPVVNQKPIFEDSPAASSLAQAVTQAAASVGGKTGSKTANTSSQVKSKSSK